MSLGDWSNYFSLPTDKRGRILNIITLEIGSSKIAEQIRRPKFVLDLDWVDIAWPKERKVNADSEYPQVQLYCLMGVKDSYTDFHIDFGGSSVFYHILSGQKIFYFIEPTKKNLKVYEKWSSSPDQSKMFLHDILDPGACKIVHLVAGNTMFIPTGWIHAIFTPVDTVVIGGNFIHGINIGLQLEIYRIENATQVPQNQWYAAKYFLGQTYVEPNDLSQFELKGILELCDFLSKKCQPATDFKKSVYQRKEARREIPLNNVEYMLAILRKNAVSLMDGYEVGVEEMWYSDLSEMEFLDPDSEDEFVNQSSSHKDDDVQFEDQNDSESASGGESASEHEEGEAERTIIKIKKPLQPKQPTQQVQPTQQLHATHKVVPNEVKHMVAKAMTIMPKPTKPKTPSVFNRLSKSLKRRR